MTTQGTTLAMTLMMMDGHDVSSWTDATVQGTTLSTSLATTLTTTLAETTLWMMDGSGRRRLHWRRRLRQR